MTLRELEFAESQIVTALAGLTVDHTLDYQPERVISIVGSSRSGSTVLKYALCLHPELTSLAGEEEPYYKLAKCGYPWNASDEFHAISNPDLVRRLISLEISNLSSEANRRVLQSARIEEPPFVEAIQCRKTPTLVLKTPQNCYRRGVIEQLYPGAQVVYLTTRRDPRATINGLIDGWQSEEFTARWTEQGWWRFDMPPGWNWSRPLIYRCVHQWCTSEKFLVNDYSDALLNIQFEEFEENWLDTCCRVWKYLGLSSFSPSIGSLPNLSITDPPERARWRKKRPWLAELNLEELV